MPYIAAGLAVLLILLLLYLGLSRIRRGRQASGAAAAGLPPGRLATVVSVEEPDAVPRRDAVWAESSGPDLAPGETTYRAGRRLHSGETQWDPYSWEQSRAARARAARARANTRPMVDLPDYYQVLGVDPTATSGEIERQYKRHVALVHPDRFYDNPQLRADAEAKLRQLNEAAEVLRDPVRRARYDALTGR